MNQINTASQETKKLAVIVSGATGDLGRAYVQYYAPLEHVACYAVSRSEEQHKIPGVTYLRSDLEDAQDTRKQIERISLDDIARIIYIHPVGKFKFEETGAAQIDKDQDGIDDEVYASNIDTFHNVLRPLLERRTTQEIMAVAFGSLSDHAQEGKVVPWWGSYSKSKLILRSQMKDLASSTYGVKSLFVNLSSVDTKNENKTRPYADKTYWINPAQIVERTVPAIEQMQFPSQEIDVYTPAPYFHANYYADFDALKAKWISEMRGPAQ